jgi:ankyrin repeat protein
MTTEAQNNFKHAVRSNQPENVKKALKDSSVDPNYLGGESDIYGFPAMLCAQNGYTEVLKILLDRGVSASTRSHHNQTPIISYALLNNKVDTAFALLNYDENNKADINAKNGSSVTPLMVAAEKTDVGTVKTLIENYSAEVTGNDSNGQNLLMHAAKNSKEVVELIFSKLSDDSNELVNAKDKEGKTALTHALENGNAEGGKFLVEHGADSSVVDNYDNTLLHSASKGNGDTVEFALGFNNEVNAKNSEGESALIVAAKNGNLHGSSALLSHGAAKDSTDNEGNNALIAAIKKLDNDDEQPQNLFKLLIKTGISAHAKDEKGGTALDYANAAGGEVVRNPYKEKLPEELEKLVIDINNKPASSESTADQKDHKGAESGAAAADAAEGQEASQEQDEANQSYEALGADGGNEGVEEA